MKTLRELILFLVVSLISTLAVGCSDDDVAETGTFYIEVKSIQGGGLSDNDVESMKADLNQRLKNEALKGNVSAVESQFVAVMNKLERELKKKLPVLKENLEVSLSLQDEKGNEVTERTIFIMKPIESK